MRERPMASIRLRLHACAAVVVVSGALAVLPASPARADTFTQPNQSTCEADPYNVPSDVLAVDVVVIGQGGLFGIGTYSHGGGDGGRGGRVSAHLSVTPGETLWAAVGCFYGARGLSALPGDDGRGGAGSGIVTTSVDDPSNRLYWTTLVVAGGGGGGGEGGDHGPGGTGGDVQSNGNDASDNESAAGAGGHGASATSGGAGGSGGCSGGAGYAGQIWDTPGGSGFGGNCAVSDVDAGGGGGGGYYNGGGGGGGDGHGGGGGGGGSDFVDPRATNVVESVTSDPASITITPTNFQSSTALTSSPNPASTTAGVSFTATITGSPSPGGVVDFQRQAASGGPIVDMGSATAAGGISIFGTPTPLPPGVWTITASYGGDAVNLGSSSAPLTQTIGTAPSLLSSPANMEADAGTTATFTATSTVSDPFPDVAWQFSPDLGTTWSTWGPGVRDVDPTAGVTTATLNVPNVAIGQNSWMFRAVFSNPLGSVTSKAATLTVGTATHVLTSPANTKGLDGTTVSLLSEADGVPLPDPTWQTSSNGGGTWTDVGPADPTFTVTTTVDSSLANKTVLSFTSTSALNGRLFRVRWTNTVNGTPFTVHSQVAQFIWMALPSCVVPEPTPANHANCAGVHFDGQFLEGLPGAYGDFSGATFVNADLDNASFNGADLSGADLSGASARVVGFNGASLAGANLSDTNLTAADLTNALLAGADLAGATFTGASVSGANFARTAILPADVTLYENGPVNASPVWGAPATTVAGLTVTCGYAVQDVPWNDGPNTVPCIVSAADPDFPGAGSITVTLVPLAGPVVTTQPVDATTTFAPAPTSYSAQFTAAASGSPPPTVQWQVSTDHGSSFTDIAGATNPTLTVNNPPISADGTQYRAVFSNAQGTDTSGAATLRVHPMPVLVVVQGTQIYGHVASLNSSTFGLPPGVTVSGTPACSAVIAPDPSSPGHSVQVPLTSALAAGTYPIDPQSCGGLTLSDTTDYALGYLGGTLTVLPAIVNVSVSGTLTIPGPLSFTETNDAPAGVLPTPFDVSCSQLSDGTVIDLTLPPGSYTVLGSSCLSPPPTNSNYAFAFRGVAGGFVVQHLVAQATVGGFQTYGSTSPTWTETDNTATLGVPPLGGSLTCTGVASQTLAEGTYPLPGASCGGLTSPIVPIEYEDGQFQVFPAPVDVTADDKSMVYGGSLPTFTFQVTGLVNQEGASVLGITCSAPSAGTTPAVGTYPIVCGDTTDTNYAVVGFTHGTLTVDPAHLTVTADDKSMAYGATALPSLTATVSGFVNDQTLATSGVTGAAHCTTTATSASAPGGYPITCTVGSLSAANYDFPDAHFVAGTLTVTTPSLTVTADNASMTYGGAVPSSLTATISGFVNGDTATTATTGAAACSTTATSTSPVGTYPITCTIGTLSATDYSFPAGNFKAGTLTIMPAHLTVTADSKTMHYGDTVPTLTATISGFVNGQTLGTSGVSGMPACITSATSTSPVSMAPYPITCAIGTLSATNYDFPTANFISGVMTVGPAHLTVTADSKTMHYGDTVPTLTATISGFVNGQTLGTSGVSGMPACITSATSTSPVSATPYPITCTVGTLTAANYDFPHGDFIAGGSTVQAKPVTVSATPASMTYGGPVPATYGASVSGLVSPDTLQSLGGSCGSSTASTTLPAGSYPGAITCSGITSTNYSVAYTAATLTVGKATLTVTADAQSMPYGFPPPALTATVTGFLNQDPGSVVTGSPKCTTTATSTSASGTYPITCDVSNMSAANYTFTTAQGTLTITRHTATVGYTGGMFFATPTASSTTADVPLQALVVPGSGGTVDLTKAGVTFELFKAGNLTMSVVSPDATCIATVSSAGVASCTTKGLAVDDWTVVPVITGSYFGGTDGDPVVVTVYQQTTDAFVTGGGWVTDPSQTVSPANRRGNFGFNVHTSATSVKGQSVFTFRGADGYDYVVKSNSWQNGGASIGLSTGSFSGKCSVIVINPTTGLVVTGLGGGNYSYRVDVTHKATTTATYAISVYTPLGALWHQAGTTSAQLPLGGGNIVVHGTAK